MVTLVLAAGLLAAGCGSGVATEAASEQVDAPASTATSTTEAQATSTSTTAAPTTTSTTAAPTTTASTLPQRCTPADVDTEYVWFFPDWTPGDVWHYEITKASESPGRPQNLGEAVTIGQIEVVSRSADGVELVWRPDGVDLSSFGLPASVTEPLLEEFGDAFGQDVGYRLDELRIFDGVTNREEVLATTEATLDAMGRMFSEAGDDSFDGVYDLMVETFGEEALIDLAATDILVLHDLEAYDLDVAADAVEWVEPAGDLFPVTMSGRAEITELVDAEGCVRVETQLVPDDEEFIAYIADLMTSFGADPAEIEAEVAELDRDSFSMTITSTGQYDLGTERFVRVTNESETIFDGEREYERITIEAVEPPAGE